MKLFKSSVFILESAKVNAENKFTTYTNLQDIAVFYHETLGSRKMFITFEHFFIFIPNFKKEEKLKLLFRSIPVKEVEQFKSIYKNFI